MTTFTPTYFDSEEYYKSGNSSNAVNAFNPTEPANNMQTGYSSKYSNEWIKVGYPVANQQYGSEKDFIEKNSLYTEKKINGM